MDPNIAMAEEEGPWENRREENGDLLSLNSEDGKEEQLNALEKDSSNNFIKPSTISTQITRSENCGTRFLHCLSQVPCGSLLAWIILLMGLGGLTGSLLIGVEKSREMLENDMILWFLEYTLIGVVVGMFVFGTLFLCIGHISTDPTSRHVFNSSGKNMCARGLNITMLIFSYVFGLVWILVTAFMTVPVTFLVLLILLRDHDNFDCIDLVNYGFSQREICQNELNTFVREGKDLLICYLVAYFSCILIAISMIHFMICISANITHLKDNRFATMNAYEEPEEQHEVHESKHSIVDTTM
ncbi:hypothetical protein ScPMuIL_011549 [Solemya velum]